jgi:hypothetical protein
MSTLQAITDELLMSAISSARERAVFIAPGVWPDLAQAIADAWHRLGAGKVTVILDVNAEACRFGYGSLEGLEILQKAASSLGETVANEPGIRICVVIADDQTFVFSPTPRLLEPSPGEETNAATSVPKTNGIVMGTPPPGLELEIGAGPEKELTRTIGLDAVKPNDVAAVEQDLKQNPAKPFDLARAVNVYNARIQFVDLTVAGCKLSQHTAKLPKHLVHIIKGNKELEKKINNSIRLLDENDKLITDSELSEVTIMAERDQIEEEFLIHVPGGTIFERARRLELEAAVTKLNTTITEFSKKVEKVLAARFAATATALSCELLPEVMNDIPPSWERFVGKNPVPEKVRYRIEDVLLMAFGDPNTKISRMKASMVFKDVTFEMLQNQDFRTIVAENFDGLPTMKQYNAAPERHEPNLFDD